jgi:hypothetical protein
MFSHPEICSGDQSRISFTRNDLGTYIPNRGVGPKMIAALFLSTLNIE